MKTKIGLLKLDQKEAIFYQYKPIAPTETSHHSSDNWENIKKIKAPSKHQNLSNEQHYFKELVPESTHFKALIIAAHGKGHSNEGGKFEAYLKKHHKNLEHLIVGHVATHNHRTENQLLAEAETILKGLGLKVAALT